MSITNIWGKIFLDNRSCSFVYIENGKGWVNKYSSQPTEGLLFYLPCCSGRSFFFVEFMNLFMIFVHLCLATRTNSYGALLGK